MTVDFAAPSYRAAASDLTVAISPLGLVELADEEFEVHGPRLNRYAMTWAFYLGHHWAYRREFGEPQITFNYVKALADYTNNFVFGKGVEFICPQETEAIVPVILDRAWNEDNQKERVLWEIGQQGGISGDCFIKVAYEEPHIQPPPGTDEDGNPIYIPGISYFFVPGRIRILVLNASFVFPEWYPHDRERFMRVKVKYKFWGTADDGTRQVFTYTELITDTAIEEYVNDELIDSRPNPLGVIPIVHIPNQFISGTPWGQSDVYDIIPLNRLYNEVATDVTDIINYHAAPVTVVIGAKAADLQKGANKMWSIPSKDASITNLELGNNLQSPLAWLAQIKQAMHELTGVPENALGQEQAVSNTSGVALAIQFQPLMNTRNKKIMQYGPGLEKVNEYVLRTLALKEPTLFQWDPSFGTELKEGQLSVLDPEDPITYRTTAQFPQPLPVDVLIKLNEIQAKMTLGLETKRGALRELGVDFPDQKMQEIFQELLQDAEDQAALDLLKSQMAAMIAAMTGMVPGDNGPEPLPPPPAQQPPGNQPSNSGSVASGGGGPVTSASPFPGLEGLQAQEQEKLMNALVTRAYGTKLPQRRNPQND